MAPLPLSSGFSGTFDPFGPDAVFYTFPVFSLCLTALHFLCFSNLHFFSFPPPRFFLFLVIEMAGRPPMSGS